MKKMFFLNRHFWPSAKCLIRETVAEPKSQMSFRNVFCCVNQGWWRNLRRKLEAFVENGFLGVFFFFEALRAEKSKNKLLYLT